MMRERVFRIILLLGKFPIRKYANQTLVPVSTQWLDVITKGNVVRISRSLHMLMLSAFALGFQASGRAQGNLVNLYDWTNQTRYVPDPNYYIIIGSFNSANFRSGITTNPLLGGPFIVEPVLTGSLPTTPGITYEISFTMQLGAPFAAFGGASLSFGNFTTNCDLQNPANGNQPGYNPPVNFDFTAVATSPTTAMSFNAGFNDYTDGMLLSNVAVMEVPEISASRLFGFGGCVLLLARQWRRLFQKWKRN
jgi:hypothetical protein